MLLRVRAPKLCRACRSDILTVFEYGSCESNVTNASVLALRQLARPKHLSRPFSSSRLYRSDVQNPGSGAADLRCEKEVVTEPNPVDPALATLRPQEGVKTHFGEAQEIDQGFDGASLAESISDAGTGDAIIYGARDPVAALRSDGASVDSIVREARQIFGESLPEGVLEENEFKIYRRLYGDPVDEADEEIEKILNPRGPEGSFNSGTPELLNELGEPIVQNPAPAHGALSEAQNPPHSDNSGYGGMVDSAAITELDGTSPLDRVRLVAKELGAEVYPAADEADFPELDAEELTSEPRAHALTHLGRFATYPRTVYLPQEAFIRPIEGVLSDYSNKHLKEMCERTFGGGGLPNSSLTPRSGRTMPQVPIPLQASQHTMGEMEANAFLTAVMPATYAAIASVLVETRKRLGSSWLRNLLAREEGPRILDAGAGGAGILAWREIVKAEWDSLHSSDRNAPAAPLGKAIVLTGSDTIRHRAATLLENTTFVPRLPDYLHVRDSATLEDDRPAPQRKEFNVIIASHSLWPFKEEWERKQHVQNLWSLLNPEGGVLILIEKGVPRGFEAIAGARELLLERYIASPDSETYENSLESPSSDDAPQTKKGRGMIIAPCTNHERCPMYPIPGMSRGRKDYCSFQQRYIRPQFLQRVLGAKDRSHDDVDFSYISILKGEDLREKQLLSFAELRDPSSTTRVATAPPTPREDATEKAFEGYEEFQNAANSEQSYGVSDPDLRGESSNAPFPSILDMPRLVYPPLKRRGHVTLDVCTPAGKIERWTVPKSFSKQAYHDARKSTWGDIWALGAKTRVVRNLRLGGPGTKEGMKARGKNNRLLDRAAEAREKMEDERLAELDEEEEGIMEEVASNEDEIPDMEQPASTLRKDLEKLDKAMKAESKKVDKRKKSKSSRPAASSSSATAAEQEDLETDLALSEWEEEFADDRRVGKKNVRSVRLGTKEKTSNRRTTGERRRSGQMITDWMANRKQE